MATNRKGSWGDPYEYDENYNFDNKLDEELDEGVGESLLEAHQVISKLQQKTTKREKTLIKKNKNWR